MLNFLENFRKYLDHAKRNNEIEELSLYKLLIFGPPRVGKSSLFKVLRGKTPKKVSKSTGICNRLMFKVAISKDATGSKSTWRKVKIEKEILQLQTTLEEKQKLSNLTEALPDTLADTNVGATASNTQLEVVKDMLENIKNPIQNQSGAESKCLMVCYDSGGQPEFFDIIPLLSTNPTGYIMVFDMSKDLSAPIQNTVCRDNIEVSSQNKHEITTIDLLKSAIAGIQPCSGDTEWYLMVVGTHTFG